MINIKNLTHKLFIATFMVVTTSSHQLHAMESEQVKTFNEVLLDADFQMYKLLSLIDYNHQCCLLPELIQIITINVSKLIDKECCEKYEGRYFYIGCYLVNFIESKHHTMNPMSLVNIAKRCLRHSNKPIDKTILNYIARNKTSVECLKIAKLIIGNETWDIICSPGKCGFTLLHESVYQGWSQASKVRELLATAPNAQEAWNLIMMPAKDGITALNYAEEIPLPEGPLIIKLLKSYRPKEQ